MPRSKPPLPEKPCRVCGRTMVWRKRWASNWDDVTTCSDACRKRRHTLGHLGETLERTILELATACAPGTLCPSEVARHLAPDAWRDLMEPTREAARRLVHRDLLDITQGGHPVDPSTARGPIRLRLRHNPNPVPRP